MIETGEFDDWLVDHPELLMDAYYEARDYLQGRLLNEHNQAWAYRLLVAYLEEEYAEKEEARHE